MATWIVHMRVASYFTNKFPFLDKSEFVCGSVAPDCGYGKKVSIDNAEKLRYYVRYGADPWLQAHTDEIWDQAVITEPVAVEEMHRWLKGHPNAFIAALLAQV